VSEQSEDAVLEAFKREIEEIRTTLRGGKKPPPLPPRPS
jgi:hypothetical protein